MRSSGGRESRKKHFASVVVLEEGDGVVMGIDIEEDVGM